MKYIHDTKCCLVITALFLNIVCASSALADNPLDYPPFKWYPLLPEPKSAKPDQVKADKQNNSVQTNIMQNKNKSKQWYEGDFMGMDDD
jgi:hypothetical protein